MDPCDIRDTPMFHGIQFKKNFDRVIYNSFIHNMQVGKI